MIKLIHGDCLDIMKKYDDDIFDLAIVDPPYGIGDWTKKYPNHGPKSEYRKKQNYVKTTRTEHVSWNNQIPNQKYFDELLRISKQQVIFGANYFNQFVGKSGALIWLKGVPLGTNLSTCEIASYSRYAKVIHINSKWQNVNRRCETIHPCQKPIDLYEQILDIEIKSMKGKKLKVFDSHFGSGSLAIACMIKGCDFVGCEISEVYFQRALKRIKNHKLQSKLFEVNHDFEICTT
tara:strand:- start:1596 stop:2297 length:702 start_codon:yes stop_codon:yes gene_type:complete